MFAAMAQFQREMMLERQRVDLAARTITSIQNVLLLADLLSLPNDGRYPTVEVSSEQRAADIGSTRVTSEGIITLHACADDL